MGNAAQSPTTAPRNDFGQLTYYSQGQKIGTGEQICDI